MIDTLRELSKPWIPAVLIYLLRSQTGKARFNDILYSIEGISDRVLTDRLRQLAADGLILRVTDNFIGSRAEYRLTEKGRRIAARFALLAEAWEAMKASANGAIDEAEVSDEER